MAGGRNRTRAAALLAVTLLCNNQAAAQALTTFDFSFTYNSGKTDYGALTGTFLALSVTGSPNTYLVQSMSGTLAGAPVTLLEPGAFAGNDNTLIYPGAPISVSFGGVAFTANGVQSNIFGMGHYYVLSQTRRVEGSTYNGSVTLRAAPGPAAGAGGLSFVALCFAGLATRFRTLARLARPLLGLAGPAAMDHSIACQRVTDVLGDMHNPTDASLISVLCRPRLNSLEDLPRQ